MIQGALNGKIIQPGIFNAKFTASKIDGKGNVWTYELDKNGRNLEETNGLGKKIKYERDLQGFPVKIVFPDGTFDTMMYDNRGNVIVKTQGDNLTSVKYEWHEHFNKPISITNANGNVTTLQYDEKTGNLTRLTDAGGAVWNYTYNSRGLLETVTDPLGNSSEYHYDESGNFIKFTDANNNTWRIERDKRGNLISLKDPLKNKKMFKYDIMNRRTHATDAEGITTQFSYNKEVSALPVEMITSIIDPAGNKIVFEYDRTGNIVGRIDALKRKKNQNI